MIEVSGVRSSCETSVKNSSFCRSASRSARRRSAEARALAMARPSSSAKAVRRRSASGEIGSGRVVAAITAPQSRPSTWTGAATALR